MSPTLQILLAIIPIIGGFLFWHFKTINSFKDQINDLKLQMKELEKRDALQQQTIDQLKDLYPTFTKAIENLNKRKK